MSEKRKWRRWMRKIPSTQWITSRVLSAYWLLEEDGFHPTIYGKDWTIFLKTDDALPRVIFLPRWANVSRYVKVYAVVAAAIRRKLNVTPKDWRLILGARGRLPEAAGEALRGSRVPGLQDEARPNGAPQGVPRPDGDAATH